jgi:hypothetical protein
MIMTVCSCSVMIIMIIMTIYFSVTESIIMTMMLVAITPIQLHSNFLFPSDAAAPGPITK